MDSDFVIVGGGIGGAVLAALLAKEGKRVVVLEKAVAPPVWTRPEILWPATVEMLFSLLPRSTWEVDALLRLGGVEAWNGRETVQLIPSATLRKVQVERWAADAVYMRERLLALGTFEVCRGEEVIGVLKETGRIAGVRTRNGVTGMEREFSALWTVGDDGVHSVVRDAGGLGISTQMFPLDFVCFTFNWPPTFDPATVRVWLNFEDPHSEILGLFAVPLPKRGAGVALVRPGIFEKEDQARAKVWERFCGLDTSLREIVQARRFPEDFARVRRIWGQAERYGVEGAVLIGDAAHPVSPAGGQGTNMSVADSRALADIALSNPADLITAYEARRRKANERSLRFTRGAARVLTLPTALLPISYIIPVVRWVGRHPSLVAPILRYVSTAFEDKKR